MQHRDIVVIGGSAGALEPLQRLLADLPAELAATLFVVIHTEGNARSALDRVLDQAGALPAAFARDGLAFGPGQIHVAPPICICCSPTAACSCAAARAKTWPDRRSTRCSGRRRSSTADA